MKTRGFDSLKRKIASIEKRVKRKTKRASFDAMEQTTTSAQAQLLTGGNVWHGELVNSLVTTQSPSSDGWTYKTRANAPHAKVVEFGSGTRFNKDPFPSSSRVQRIKAPQLTDGLIAAMWNWVQTKHPFYGSPTYGVAMGIAQTVGVGELGGLEGEGRGTNSHPYLRPAFFTNWYPVGQSSGVRSIKRAYRSAVRI